MNKLNFYIPLCWKKWFLTFKTISFFQQPRHIQFYPDVKKLLEKRSSADKYPIESDQSEYLYDLIDMYRQDEKSFESDFLHSQTGLVELYGESNNSWYAGEDANLNKTWFKNKPGRYYKCDKEYIRNLYSFVKKVLNTNIDYSRGLYGGEFDSLPDEVRKTWEDFVTARRILEWRLGTAQDMAMLYETIKGSVLYSGCSLDDFEYVLFNGCKDLNQDWFTPYGGPSGEHGVASFAFIMVLRSVKNKNGEYRYKDCIKDFVESRYGIWDGYEYRPSYEHSGVCPIVLPNPEITINGLKAIGGYENLTEEEAVNMFKYLVDREVFDEPFTKVIAEEYLDEDGETVELERLAYKSFLAPDSGLYARDYERHLRQSEERKNLCVYLKILNEENAYLRKNRASLLQRGCEKITQINSFIEELADNTRGVEEYFDELYEVPDYLEITKSSVHLYTCISRVLPLLGLYSNRILALKDSPYDEDRLRAIDLIISTNNQIASIITEIDFEDRLAVKNKGNANSVDSNEEKCLLKHDLFIKLRKRSDWIDQYGRISKGKKPKDLYLLLLEEGEISPSRKKGQARLSAKRRYLKNILGSGKTKYEYENIKCEDNYDERVDLLKDAIYNRNNKEFQLKKFDFSVLKNDRGEWQFKDSEGRDITEETFKGGKDEHGKQFNGVIHNVKDKRELFITIASIYLNEIRAKEKELQK